MRYLVSCFALFGLLQPIQAFAAQAISPEHDPIASVLFWVTVVFSFALLGRYFARCCHQPGVLGELLMGVVLGNVGYYFGDQLVIVLREGSTIFTIMRDMLAGVSLADAVTSSIKDTTYATQMIMALSSNQGIDYLKIGYALDMFSRFGVIFLLFMVGLESSLDELKHTGRQSLQVALIGIIAPMLLGFFMVWLLMPDVSWKTNLFIAATLSATSIGITARVLSDMKTLHTREARTILGAAMLDDILGLIILAVVSSIVINGQVDVLIMVQVIIATLLFFAGALWIGPWLLHRLVSYCFFLEPWEAKLFISFAFVMMLAWLATLVQLSSIIGAFAAGMIINDAFFKSKDESHQSVPSIRELIAPFEFLLAPLFFMLIGIQVKLESFFDWQVLLIASGLIIAAILGKLLSGLGAHRQDDRVLIGIGMMPRGEVGLVFASIGRTLGVISNQLFSAIILMVIITTVIVPPLLKMRYVYLNKGNQS